MVTEKINVSLEEYLADGNKAGVDEFTVRFVEGQDRLTFYIRPTNQNGETLNFAVDGNSVECVSERIVKL